ncbi:16S rRNA (cytidine(1402)-2'-O)-methyltransferase [Frankia sp. CcI49]|uniref:16S rRNA (cytidine(1402)-2'-O)-methyltransferase n=1 Tax=unclassified Frankia TaxID=2632575 RepID=UPI0006CA14BA|nr:MULTISPECIES: 16S rRNA (cytidine(1402)-2'-O)-methyltransferase [unclassified Frankia]KPM50440.1 16S rRNA methyltransferase [Frankia sp. R43]ONH58018.1 16S rRNA (cytidine(1402)-2'-O)-methyltransferase [Frankia sp. CcI49]
MSGTLVLCGAPIGDPRDASPRLGEVLASADIVAAEDTRRLRRLAHTLGITIGGRVVSCYDAVEGARAEMLTEQLLAGRTVALITDAGMPGVSDPGYRLVAAAARAGVAVTVVAGPSAVTAALAVSGLPSDRWTFEGFLPRKAGERRARLRGLAAEPRTMVFLESPHRLLAALRDLADVLGGGRRAALCRELTKTWEEIVRTDLAGLVEWATDGRVIRGEFTLVIAGAGAGGGGGGRGAGGAAGVAGAGAVEEGAGGGAVGPAALAAAVARLIAGGMAPKEARKAVAAENGVTPRQVYDAVIATRDSDAEAEAEAAVES